MGKGGPPAMPVAVVNGVCVAPSSGTSSEVPDMMIDDIYRSRIKNSFQRYDGRLTLCSAQSHVVQNSRQTTVLA
jgi:hypothetical protein